MLRTKGALVMTILIAVVAGIAGIAASTMVAKPVYSISPPPSCFIAGYPNPSDTRLTLDHQLLGNQEGGVWVVKELFLQGKLLCINPLSGREQGIAEATISSPGSGVPPNASWQTKGVETQSDGASYTFMDVPKKPGTYNVQAHFSGVTMPMPGHSDIVWKLTGSDSNIETFVMK
jgi:hypothetical protein